ncbi:MAG: hypothetical protein LBD06_08650 [Candidatus Accumulibacter sp.]|nr:hypothetical protein [Accumulibacter sp.]
MRRQKTDKPSARFPLPHPARSVPEDRVQGTEFRGQRLEKAEDRKTKRSVFRLHPARSAASSSVFCLLKSLSSDSVF